MLYLDEVVIHNFRSFKGTSTIKFSKGFNCIVGPNGSGKSSIASSLMFGLGETALRRLDVTRGTALINVLTRPSKEDGKKRAWAKVRFSGDKEIEVTRIIRSDKKVAYRLNGKRATRQAITEVLREAKCGINLTNSVTQNETKRLLGLSPKERRMLIDEAAGISEFNDKRDSAIKELDKVQEKITMAKVQLGERNAFLGGLEKEKRDAEAWLALSNRIKSAEYTILRMRVGEITASLETAVRAHTERSQKKHDVEQKMAELDSRVSQHLSEKDMLLKSMNAKSAELSSKSTILQGIIQNLAVAATQQSAIGENMASSTAKIGALSAGLKDAESKRKANSEAAKKLAFELEVKSKGLPGRADTESDAYDYKSANDRYIKNNGEIEGLSRQLVGMSQEYARLESERESAGKEIAELQSGANALGRKRAGLSASIKACKESITAAEAGRAELEKEMAGQKEASDALGKRSDAAYAEINELKYSIAKMGGDPSSRIAEALRKSVRSGIYGTADELCTYDDKYALAVQAAGGPRLRYFIVESMDVVEEAIGVLKAQKLGRATFIPLDEIRAKQQKPDGKMQPLLGLVEFDKRYSRAFDYIFSDTYLVDDIKAAQKAGLGSHRFVTLGGEVVEPSGAVSGGSMKAARSVAAMEARIGQLEAERKELQSRIADADATMSGLRRKASGHETAAASRNIEMKSYLSIEDEVNRELDSSEERTKALEQGRGALSARMGKAKLESGAVEKQIAALKEENSGLVQVLERSVSKRGGGAKAKEEAAKLDALRAEIESIKVHAGALEKENEMLEGMCGQAEAELNKEKSALTILKGKAAQLAAEMEANTRKRAELEEQLQAQGSRSSGISREITELDAKTGRLAAEKGKLQLEQQRLGVEIMEMEGKRSNYETRLTDVKSQMLAYQNQQVETIEGAKMDELERQNIISKSEMEKLGNVNLKAPETYAEKKRDVDEAQQRVSVLESEKASVLAMIEEIDTKKINVFNETLLKVNENFKRLYGYIFAGDASLKLKDPADPFNSGLLIETTDKKLNADTASGGQKSLMSLMLLFAIQQRDPMAFYIFDEPDISLDQENAKKLSKLIKEMSAKSQFIVVSHNNTLITEADAAIGVALNQATGSQTYGLEIAGVGGKA